MKNLLLLFLLCVSFSGLAEQNSLKEMQVFQVDFDEKYFEINHDFEKVRHILLHLVKTTGKMATFVEAKEHGRDADPVQIVNEVIPDLLFHALQLANQYNIDLGDKYAERIQFIIDRANQTKK